MKVAIELFTSILILSLTVCVSIGIISSDLAVMDARDAYTSYVNELQESNFADSVVTACIEDALAEGHSLNITIMEDGNGNRSANISMKFNYKLAPLGINQEKSIEGYIS